MCDRQREATVTAILDRAPVDEISARAREIRFGRSVKRLLIGILFYAGWLLAKTLGLAWLAVAFCWSAIDMGWREARGNQPSRATLREENDRLREQLRRLGG